ncbi:MAG: cytosine deaminase [Xanthobacteraceae bacterium]|nr:cytosine deaminase [Xanthobacteraceae bacterium]
MSHDFITIPSADRYRIINARLPIDLAPELEKVEHTDRFAACEILVESGRITALNPPNVSTSVTDAPAVDLRDGIALPRFVDIHTHIDKGHIWPRHPNPDGSFFAARTAVAEDREANWNADDVRARMDFSLRCAFAHGTSALRTHLDSLGKQAAISWPVFTEMRETWKDRIALQAVALFPTELAVDDEPQFRRLVNIVARHGGKLGGITFLGEAPSPKLELALDRTFAMAAAHGLDLDLHVDESTSPDARSLERIALSAIRHRFMGRIVAGHCCSLTLAEDDHRARVIELLGQANVAVISLPMCNMYLQDRTPGRTPRLRAVAPLHELDAAGVAVAVASDNTRDPFYAYGDLDMLEIFREATRILQLDHSDRPWLRLFGVAPAEIAGFRHHGRIATGLPADLVLTRARTIQELLARPQHDRVVLVNGRAIDRTLPDYRELDHLYKRTTHETATAHAQ